MLKETERILKEWMKDNPNIQTMFTDGVSKPIKADFERWVYE